ncbi:hypothetical protein ABS771_28235, partial [Methylobacterium brachiatum]
MPEPTPGRLMIGITLFRPSPDQVDRVLAQAVSGCAGVIAFDDGGLAEADAERLTRAGVTVLSAGRNLGIAEALNRIAAASPCSAWRPTCATRSMPGACRTSPCAGSSPRPP